MERIVVREIEDLNGRFQTARAKTKVAADSQVPDVKRRQRELSVVSCRVGEPDGGREWVRDDASVGERDSWRPELGIGRRQTCGNGTRPEARLKGVVGSEDEIPRRAIDRGEPDGVVDRLCLLPAQDRAARQAVLRLER